MSDDPTRDVRKVPPKDLVERLFEAYGRQVDSRQRELLRRVARALRASGRDRTS
jgi:hypothetical protein